MGEMISVKDAARIIGCREQKVREKMKRGVWDIGTVMTPKQRGSGQTYAYNVFIGKLASLLGREVSDIEKQIDEAAQTDAEGH